MRYQRISADCHIDLPWIPPDLFTANASAALKDRMPYVTDGPDGRYWTAKNGTSFGLWGGVGLSLLIFAPFSGPVVEQVPETANAAQLEGAHV